MVGIATIPQQKRWVAVISNQDVSEAVVVVVKKTAAEAEDVVCWSGDAEFIADFVEVPFAVTMPNMVRRSLEVRNVQIQPAVIIIVTQGNAHRSHQMATG